MQTPVHVVAGFLGTGKTTALLAQLASREGREKCAVIVNDFGEAQIDATLLGGAVAVTSIAGGCVCCTAPEGLAPALEAILDTLKPDRIFIEPSGLARPRDIVDMLSRGVMRDRITIMPAIVLVDVEKLDHPLVAEQIEGADVLLAGRADLARTASLTTFHTRAGELWPAPLLVGEVRGGELPEMAFVWPAGAGPRAAEADDHDHAHSTAGFMARSFVFSPDTVFAWDELRKLLAHTEFLARFKGLFRTELGWFRLDWAGGVMLPGQTAYRRDSRADVILEDAGDLDRFEAGLRAAILPEGDALFGDEAAVALVDADGILFPLTRGALMALPGQVADVSTVVPGRQGSGVYLRELLALAGPGTRFVVSAADGLAAAPAEIDGVGDAILVHSLNRAPLPDDQGGPFRVLVPPGQNGCAAIKGVVRVRVLPGE